MLDIKITHGDLLKAPVDALVAPAHILGYMGYGAAKAIVRAGGQRIEKEAIDQAPLVMGEAIATTAGDLPFKAIIHTATFDDANTELTQANVSKAVLGALLLADENGLTSIAFPGMGTGIGGMNYDMAAQAMRGPLKSFVPHSLKTVYLTDLSQEMVDSWNRYFGK